MYYRRTQTAWATILVFGVVLVFIAASALLALRMQRPQAVGVELFLAVVVLVLAFCLVCFSSMTVTVDDTVVTLQFGPGPIRKSFQLTDIKLCRPVRNRWWWGWGIKRIPGGWLYSVSGQDAVELVMKDGRVFRIGTDEPKALAEFIQMKLKRIV